LHETGWVEQVDQSRWVDRDDDEDNDQLDDSEPRGFAQSAEGKQMLDKVIELGTAIRFWKNQSGNEGSCKKKELQGVTLETDTKLEDVARERVDESEPLQNKILKILTSKATSKLKGVSKWRDLLAGRTFRAPSALHYLSCTKSDNVHTLPLLKFHRAGGETKANSQDLVKRVVNCIQNRQMRRTEQLSALGTVAAESTNEVLDEITGLIREGHLEDIKGFLQQGKVMGSEECVRAE